MSDAGPAPPIEPLPRPGQALRLAFLRAYRDGLRTSPARAWEDALVLAREHFPDAGESARQRMLLLCLGLFGTGSRHPPTGGDPPNEDGHMPCLLPPEIHLRLWVAARHYGLTVDELVSRVADAWMSAACDFDGVPENGMPVPPPLAPRS